MTRSRTEIMGRTRRARLVRTVGPEAVASAASALVVVAVAFMLAQQPGVPAAQTPTLAPGFATSTAEPTPTRTPIGSSLPTPTPWAAQAALLLGVEVRLDAIRAALAAALANDPPSTTEISRELRVMNTTLTSALEAISALGSAGAPPGLVEDLQRAHQETLRVSLETLQSSIQNGPAYEAGAGEAVTLLDEIAALATRLRMEAGIPSTSAP